MGVWKTSVTVRIKVEERAALQAHADREQRTLSNLAELLLAWALEGLDRVGSTEKLLGRKVSIPRRPRVRREGDACLPGTAREIFKAETRRPVRHRTC